MKTMRLVTSGIVGLGVFLAPSAWAAFDSATWYSSSSPLTAKVGSTTVAQAYGTVFTNGYPYYVYNESYQRDPYSNGIGVTVKNKFCFVVSGLDPCSGNVQTGTTTSSSWTYKLSSSNPFISSAAGSAYDKILVCQNVNNAPDDCSGEITRNVVY